MKSVTLSLLFITFASLCQAFIPLKVIGRLSMPVIMQHSLLRAARIGKLQEVGLPAIRISSGHGASHVYPHVTHQQVATHGSHVISDGGHHGGHHGGHSIGHFGGHLGGHGIGHHGPLHLNTGNLAHLHDHAARDLGLRLGIGSATGFGLQAAGLGGGLAGGLGGGLGGGLAGGFDGGLAGGFVGALGGGGI